jgi:hypothetical protein
MQNEAEEQTEDVVTLPQTLTPELLQAYLRDLETWLAARNLVIVPVARGKETGQFAAVDDFLRGTHVAAWTLGARS